MRLNRFLAACGVASRRKSDDLIRDGRVNVNGEVVTDFSTTVSDTDRVEVDGEWVQLPKSDIFIVLHKPKGYLTTASDTHGRSTVMQLLPALSERVYPVGRLDMDTAGVLLFTNVGEAAFRLTHPKYGVEKTYLAEVKGIPAEKDLIRLEKGVLLDDGMTSPAKVKQGDMSPCQELIVTIHEGRKRQVRRMCEAIGHPVISLTRIQFGSIKLAGIDVGKWRYLNDNEIKTLLQMVEL